MHLLTGTLLPVLPDIIKKLPNKCATASCRSLTQPSHAVSSMVSVHSPQERYGLVRRAASRHPYRADTLAGGRPPH